MDEGVLEEEDMINGSLSFYIRRRFMIRKKIQAAAGAGMIAFGIWMESAAAQGEQFASAGVAGRLRSMLTVYPILPGRASLHMYPMKVMRRQE